jgi:hypothetical protein
VLSKALWPPHRDSYMRTTEGQRNAERAQRESRATEVRECAAKGIIEDGARTPRPDVLTKELQRHNDQHEEHHYDYHRGKRFPAHYTPPHS